MYDYLDQNTVHYISKNSREDESLINNEKKVTAFLEKIKDNPDNYFFDVYQRKALGQGKRNNIMLHSLFVITDKSSGEETTLSFNGTKLGLTSTGAWATNTEMDVNSYHSYRKGNNLYDMVHLVPGNIIDSEKTASNIINSINSDTTYFAIDHKFNKLGAENCNTALFNTLSIKQQSLPIIPLSKTVIINKSYQIIKEGK